MLRKIIKTKTILTLCILSLLACGCMANDSDMLEKSFYTMIDYNDKANIAFDNRNYSNTIKYADLGLDYFEKSDNVIYLTKTLEKQNKDIKDIETIRIGLYCLKGISELNSNKISNGKNTIREALSINPDTAAHILFRKIGDQITYDNNGSSKIKNKKLVNIILDEIIGNINISPKYQYATKQLKERCTNNLSCHINGGCFANSYNMLYPIKKYRSIIEPYLQTIPKELNKKLQQLKDPSATHFICTIAINKQGNIVDIYTPGKNNNIEFYNRANKTLKSIQLAPLPKDYKEELIYVEFYFR